MTLSFHIALVLLSFYPVHGTGTFTTYTGATCRNKDYSSGVTCPGGSFQRGVLCVDTTTGVHMPEGDVSADACFQKCQEYTGAMTGCQFTTSGSRHCYRFNEPLEKLDVPSWKTAADATCWIGSSDSAETGIYGCVQPDAWCAENESHKDACNGTPDDCWAKGMELCDSKPDCLGVQTHWFPWSGHNEGWSGVHNAFQLCIGASSIASIRRGSGGSNWALRMKGETCSTCDLNNAVDLVFLVDGSGSLQPAGFVMEQTFTQQFVSNFEIGNAGNEMRVGVVKFSDNANTEIELTAGITQTVVTDKINGMQYIGGNTHTWKGIQKAESILDGQQRTEAHKLIIVLTDGKSNDRSLTVAAAEAASAKDYKFFSVGVGANLDNTELRLVAGNDNRKFTYATLEDLVSSVDLLSTQICGLINALPLTGNLWDRKLVMELTSRGITRESYNTHKNVLKEQLADAIQVQPSQVQLSLDRFGFRRQMAVEEDLTIYVQVLAREAEVADVEALLQDTQAIAEHLKNGTNIEFDEIIAGAFTPIETTPVEAETEKALPMELIIVIVVAALVCFGGVVGYTYFSQKSIPKSTSADLELGSGKRTPEN